jgi:hypothetical protein
MRKRLDVGYTEVIIVFGCAVALTDVEVPVSLALQSRVQNAPIVSAVSV